MTISPLSVLSIFQFWLFTDIGVEAWNLDGPCSFNVALASLMAWFWSTEGKLSPRSAVVIERSYLPSTRPCITSFKVSTYPFCVCCHTRLLRVVGSLNLVVTDTRPITIVVSEGRYLNLAETQYRSIVASISSLPTTSTASTDSSYL